MGRCLKCGYKPCACGLRFKTQEEIDAMLAKPAPAPLRDPRDGAHEILYGKADAHAGKSHFTVCDRITAAIIADRAARQPPCEVCAERSARNDDTDARLSALVDRTAAVQDRIDAAARPDVAQLRELLEEGARLVGLALGYNSTDVIQAVDVSTRLGTWARRVREAIGP